MNGSVADPFISVADPFKSVADTFLRCSDRRYVLYVYVFHCFHCSLFTFPDLAAVPLVRHSLAQVTERIDSLQGARFRRVLALDSDDGNVLNISSSSEDEFSLDPNKRAKHSSAQREAAQKKAASGPSTGKGKGSGKKSKSPGKQQVPLDIPPDLPGLEFVGDVSDLGVRASGVRESPRKRGKKRPANFSLSAEDVPELSSELPVVPLVRTDTAVKKPGARSCANLGGYWDEECGDFGLATNQEVGQAKLFAFMNGLKLLRVSTL
jgi:hypothetical protein